MAPFGVLSRNERLGADRVAVPVGHLSTAPAVARGERDAHLRVDVAERADVGALTNLHAGEHRHPGVACAGAVGSASAAIGAAAAANMRNHRRRTMASDLQVSRLSSVPVSCGLLYPEPTPQRHTQLLIGRRRCDVTHPFLAEAPRGKPSR